MTLRELFTSPEKWIKHQFARDNAGLCVSWSSPRACCWCLTGAVELCYPHIDGRPYAQQPAAAVYSKLDAAARELYPLLAHDGLVTFNDHPSVTFEHLKAVVEKADV